MKKSHRVMLVLALVIGLSAYSAMVFAAPAASDAKPAAAAPAAKPTPHAAGKHAMPPGVPAVVTGKIETKMVKNKKTGQDMKRFFITVATAKGADGAAMDALKGKSLMVGCKKDMAPEVEKFVGKDAEITGALVAQRNLIRLKSIK